MKKIIEASATLFNYNVNSFQALNVEEYQVQQEQKLVRELEAMKDELAPLEDCRKILAEQAERRANNLTWLGLGLMSVQFGILARLTWWEYSWDIMEPGKNMASNTAMQSTIESSYASSDVLRDIWDGHIMLCLFCADSSGLPPSGRSGSAILAQFLSSCTQATMGCRQIQFPERQHRQSGTGIGQAT